MALLGVVIFAFAMGNINTLMSATDGVRLKFEDKLRAVSEYLNFRDADITLRRRIASHFGGCWRQSGAVYQEEEILEDLPRNLRKTIFEHVSTMAEVEVPMLKGLEAEACGRIYLLLLPIHFNAQETIYKRGEEGGEMYVVTFGSVILTDGNGKHLDKKDEETTIYRSSELLKQRKVDRDSQEPGPYFGHMSLFQEICMLTPEVARAETNVETMCLTRKIADKIRVFCPDFCDRLFDFCLLSASRYGLGNESMSCPKNLERGCYPKIEQMCADYRLELMSRHKRILVLKGSHGARNEGTPIEDKDSIVQCSMLVCAKGMFMQSLPPPDQILPENWMSGLFTITETLEIWYVVDEIGHLIAKSPKLLGTLKIDEDEFRKTCRVWKQQHRTSSLEVQEDMFSRLNSSGALRHEGLVKKLMKKRGQIDTAWKSRFFVLNLSENVLEYWEDEMDYDTHKKKRQRGSVLLSTGNIKVTSATPNGNDESDEGYHFTLTSDDHAFLDRYPSKMLECACETAEARDMCVQKIQESIQLYLDQNAARPQVVHA